MRLAIVGDLLWMDPLPESDGVARTLDVIGSAHAAFGNLEAPASAKGAPVQKLVRFRIDPRRLVDMAQIGFRVLSVANNHSLDFGVDAFLDTLRHLGQRHIAAVGGGENLRAARSPAFLTIGGLKVAFLAAASTLPAGFAAEHGRPGIAPIHITETLEIDPGISMEQPGTSPFVHTRALHADVEAAQTAVRQASYKADVVIFAVHWGVPPFWRAPFQGDLAEYQQPLGRALIDAGADLVVGHHAHSLQGIEVYRGKPIVYSLGNFIFHMPSHFDDSPQLLRLPYGLDRLQDQSWKESMLLILDMDQPGNAKYEIWPLSLDVAGNPYVLEGDEARDSIERLAVLSQPFGAHVAFIEDRGRLLL